MFVFYIPPLFSPFLCVSLSFSFFLIFPQAESYYSARDLVLLEPQSYKV